MPVVDLALPIEESAQVVGRAARSSGFFYVKNHGVSEELLARQFSSSEAFFDLPTEQKLKLKTNEANRYDLAGTCVENLGALTASKGIKRGLGFQALNKYSRCSPMCMCKFSASQ